MKRSVALLLAICLAMGMAACSRSPRQNTEGPAEAFTRDFFAMNTYISLTAYGEEADTALEQAQERIQELEGLWSVTDENSDIFRINQNSGQSVTVSGETARIVSFALEMAEKTDGALEPTIYPVLAAWGFTTEEHRIPAQEEIDGLLKSVGYRRVSLEGNTVQVEPGMMLDLGAVGKGYASDEAADLLREAGVRSALLDLGGNILLIGSRPDGTPWRLGLRNPFEDGNLGILTASDCAVVTSGSYENYFIGEDGVTYGHILDPVTGHPVRNDLASVTIVAEEGKLCDALSTSLYVMGAEGAEEYWRGHSGFEMILVTQDGQVLITEGLEGQFTLDADMEMRVISR